MIWVRLFTQYSVGWSSPVSPLLGGLSIKFTCVPGAIPVLLGQRQSVRLAYLWLCQPRLVDGQPPVTEAVGPSGHTQSPGVVNRLHLTAFRFAPPSPSGTFPKEPGLSSVGGDASPSLRYGDNCRGRRGYTARAKKQLCTRKGWTGRF
jgi:hypothetical protein